MQLGTRDRVRIMEILHEAERENNVRILDVSASVGYSGHPVATGEITLRSIVVGSIRSSFSFRQHQNLRFKGDDTEPGLHISFSIPMYLSTFCSSLIPACARKNVADQFYKDILSTPILRHPYVVGLRTCVRRAVQQPCDRPEIPRPPGVEGNAVALEAALHAIVMTANKTLQLRRLCKSGFDQDAIPSIRFDLVKMATWATIAEALIRGDKREAREWMPPAHLRQIGFLGPTSPLSETFEITRTALGRIERQVDEYFKGTLEPQVERVVKDLSPGGNYYSNRAIAIVSDDQLHDLEDGYIATVNQAVAAWSGPGPAEYGINGSFESGSWSFTPGGDPPAPPAAAMIQEPDTKKKPRPQPAQAEFRL